MNTKTNILAGIALATAIVVPSLASAQVISLPSSYTSNLWSDTESMSARLTPSDTPTFQAGIEEITRALQNSPHFKNLNQQQRIDRVEFIVGNTLFRLAHEMGHVLINELTLPLLGREEDAADTYAALTMLHTGNSFSLRVLYNAANGWFLNDRRDQQTAEEPLYYDEHGLNQQRAYQIVCLMVGSNPTRFKELADETKMPAARQRSCKRDYDEASSSWAEVLKPHMRTLEGPENKIDVVYGDGKGNFDGWVQSFRTLRLLEVVAEQAKADFALPARLTLEMQSCGRPETFFETETRTVTVCYEQAFDFGQLYLAYLQPRPPAAPQLTPLKPRVRTLAMAHGKR